MGKQRWRSLVTLVSTTPLLGCSLMGLDDFGVKPCTTNADCSKAGPLLRPGPSACGGAVCQSGLCEWQNGQESCDGTDNDCDGLIDNWTKPPPPTPSTPAVQALRPAAVAYAINSAQTFVAVAVDGGASQGFTLDPDGVASTHELQYESVQGEGCPRPGEVSSGGSMSCNFAELALAADESHLVFASINTLGCAAGQLRVGLSNLDDAPFKVWLGRAKGVPTNDENIAFGVDTDNAQRCTGAGATRPAVASLGTEAGGGGALLLWLSTPANRGDMPTVTILASNAPDSIPVQALGLVLPAEKPEWLNGTDQGQPVRLGRSTSRSTPAVLALKSPSGPGKYLVAFPAERGQELGIQLLAVHVSKAHLQYETLDFLNVGAADQVSLALGKTGGELGLVWRCRDGADPQLCFTTVSALGTWPAPQTILPFKGLDPSFAAQILYRGAGFALVEPTGGWLLSWTSDTQQSQIARVREGAREVLTQDTLHRGAIAETLLYPTSSDDVSSVGYAMIRPATTGPTVLETKPAWCQ